jgi:hypothetical protein
VGLEPPICGNWAPGRLVGPKEAAGRKVALWPFSFSFDFPNSFLFFFSIFLLVLFLLFLSFLFKI